ncbi:MAG: HutD family protein, partial [Proteobacteria bacterium]|nr:HutD family protein [Pseudomonadota bacterium]
PPGLSVTEDFDWRISLAHLTGSGPFSAFPGYDRMIVQISGTPMLLRHGNNTEETLQRFKPYKFMGEWPTEAFLEGTEAQDYNLMTKRQTCSGDIEYLCLNNHEVQERIVRSVGFLWTLGGYLEVEAHDKSFSVAEGESLLIEQALDLKLRFKAAAASLLIAHIKYL